MGLGERVIDRLRSGDQGAIEVIDGAVRARLDVVGAGPYGSEVRGVTVTGPKGHDVGTLVRALEGRLGFLPERLRAFEVNTELERGVLRTPRSEVRGREYYELTVEPGVVELGRFRGLPEGGRELIPENWSHRTLGRLLDELGEAVRSE